MFPMLGRHQVDPHGFGLFLWPRVAMHESVGVACVGATHGGLAALDPGIGVAVAQDIYWDNEGYLLTQQELRASSIDPKRSENSRRYLRVFNRLPEKAVSSETCGRL